ncbi:glycoside hydrolase family 99-like domain-containing protein [Desulfonatronum thioautotrophicum]|uniref:glycoside hydrolase family 99-like domain-containing protein n=1 Tax=Desulfonatronum thioautotrophicum TaxID=617001 RepID=UPI0009FF74F8|nr:glycoside hydrolase family 99-like domain-containing protein [Desulfonatronum thioautotrophicum]
MKTEYSNNIIALLEEFSAYSSDIYLQTDINMRQSLVKKQKDIIERLKKHFRIVSINQQENINLSVIFYNDDHLPDFFQNISVDTKTNNEYIIIIDENNYSKFLSQGVIDKCSNSLVFIIYPDVKNQRDRQLLSWSGLFLAMEASTGLALCLFKNENFRLTSKYFEILESNPSVFGVFDSKKATDKPADLGLPVVWRPWVHERYGFPDPLQCLDGLLAFFRYAGKLLPTICHDNTIHIPDYKGSNKVSIIIPVWNHADYTKQCLESLSTITRYHNLEVIIVDNGSVDSTKSIVSKYNIRLLSNAENQGFTVACNQGAAIANGEYLLFLNNDTIPLAGWLESLVRVLDDNPWVGAVGSRLIYPDGTLQEASAIVHNDATVTNFGRYDHPAYRKYNKPCEVDYCSGACFLVRRTLFHDLGGFDLRYSPAYYEETDLCFSIREKGLVVLYEPASTLIHFGSTTAGLDPTKGVRRHLLVNRIKFFNKWKKTLLNHEMPPSQEEEVTTCDRGQLGRRIGKKRELPLIAECAEKPKICIVSDFMPRFNASSSNLRVSHLIRLMKDAGHPLEYIYFVRDPEDRKYQQAHPGVLFCHVPFNVKDLLNAIMSSNSNIIWLTNLWTVEWLEYATHIVRYIKKHLPYVSIVMDTMDFHAKKNHRKYLADRIPEDLATSARFLEIERDVYPLVNSLVTVTNEECRDIQNAIPDCAPITILPNIHEVPRSIPPLPGRSHLVFLGNFSVLHNRDGVHWFLKNVLPIIIAKHPDIEFHLVGRDADKYFTESSGLRIIGFADNLEKMLAKYRVFVCPLTYGAGMKGKIGSAAACGLPTVTTTIGLEGFPLVHGVNCLVADTANDFADACLTLVKDDTLWNKLSNEIHAMIRKHYSPRTVGSQLYKLLDGLGASAKRGVSSMAKGEAGQLPSDPGFSSPEADTMDASQPDARVLAFYLPQFHQIPENDAWWGKGFTDWVNVRKTKPSFSGHLQPMVPTELGYYDLKDIEIMHRQAQLAKDYGLHGFCFYHYWFHGRRILEHPLDNYLSSNISLPFCLCWANENWSKNWDGGNRELLLEQAHSLEDDEAHFELLSKFFSDPRYVRIDGKPLFLVYRAGLMPDPAKTASLWRKMAKRKGLRGLYLCKVEGMSAERDNPIPMGFDAAVEFQPDWANLGPHRPEKLFGDHRVYDYTDFSLRQMSKSSPPYKRFPCVTPRWDNTPRRPKDSVILLGSSPDMFRRWLSHAIDGVQSFSRSERVVFLNAWNEWAEGSALEPDLCYGRGFLKSVRDALDKSVRHADHVLNARDLEQIKVAATHNPICYGEGFLGMDGSAGAWVGPKGRLLITPPSQGGQLKLCLTGGNTELYSAASLEVALHLLGNAHILRLSGNPPHKQILLDIAPDQKPFDIGLTCSDYYIPAESGVSQDRGALSVQVHAEFMTKER